MGKKGCCIYALKTPSINFIKNLLDYFQYICTYIYLYALMPAINLKIILNNSNLKRNLELSSNIVVGVWQGTALDLGLLALSKYMSYKFAFTFELNLTVHLASLPALRKMTVYPQGFSKLEVNIIQILQRWSAWIKSSACKAQQQNYIQTNL